MRFPTPSISLATVLLLLCMALPSLGQEAGGKDDPSFAELVDRAFGQDQELVNGLQYYNHHPKSMGTPYLLDGFVRQGWVSIRGVIYNPVWLRYDIHSQQVEVEYTTLNGADNQVVLVSDRVDHFQMGEYFFRNLSLQGEEEQFYQVPTI